jgi:uncharacterized protein
MKYSFFTILLFFISTLSNAQTDSLPKSLLWEISGKGINKSYLFGTIHLIDEKNYFLSKNLQSQFKKAEILVMEINLKKDMNLLSVMSKIFMPKNITLDSLLAPDEVKKIVEKSSEWGLPANMVKKIKPMFLSMMGEANTMKNEENSNTKSYEIELMKIAEDQKKEIGGLESVAFQLSIFDSIPYTSQAKMLLKQCSKDATELPNINEMDGLVELYKAQDIDKMCSIENMGFDDESMNNFLLIKRNTAWISRMIDFMQKSKSFFAVGAGHLGGQNGVIRLLKASGYIVKPLNNTN